jgi:hypothetical protein
MTISALGHTYSVAVTYSDGGDSKPTLTVDMHQSIKKPLYYMRFNAHLPDDAINLAYVAVDDIEADDNIVIMDRSTIAPENSPEYIAGEESFTGDNYSSFYKNILITDVYTTAIPSQPTQPLYYRHVLSGDIETTSIYILDSNFEKVNSNTYRVIAHPEYTELGALTGSIESVGIYNDLQSSFDDDTGELVVYYVQYVDTADTTKTVLLNNEEVYSEATFTDMDWASMLLKTWVKAYLLNQVGNHYEFTLPTSTDYTVRLKESIRLHVEKPAIDSNEFPWLVRITNGSFTHTVGTDTYTYHVPEFSDQQFNPIEPYKFVLGEEIDKVGAGLVQLRHTPTALASQEADIIIVDQDDTVLYALTTDTTKTGTTYYREGVSSGISWNTDKILSYDSQSGLVHLDVTLKDYYTITANYYYTEEYYEFSLVNLNPLINTDVLEHFYVIYLIPETNANAGLETAIHYLKVGRDGLVKYCSQTDIAADPVGYPYGRPIDQADVGSATDFLRLYTLEAPTGFAGESYPNRYLVLAELSVIHQTSIDDVVVLDNRQRGGGIKEEYDAEAKQINPEVSWYGDIGLGGGISYPGKSAVIVRLPRCLIDEYGGPFTESEITEVVKRHMPFGHYAVIELYGITPDVSISGASSPEEITIQWSSEGSGCTYNVYYSTTGERYEKYNANPLTDSSGGNSYTLTSLTAGLTYYVYVRAISDNPCGISTTPTNICGGGGDAAVSIGAGDGFSAGHEGPPSTILQIKPLPVV